jgi:uncharacterized protein YgiM (DUF1202 family)
MKAAGGHTSEFQTIHHHYFWPGYSAYCCCSVYCRNGACGNRACNRYVNTRKLNMRSGAGTKTRNCRHVNKNDAVNVYEVSGTWLRIDVPSIGKSGYVSGIYISINSASLSA